MPSVAFLWCQLFTIWDDWAVLSIIGFTCFFRIVCFCAAHGTASVRLSSQLCLASSIFFLIHCFWNFSYKLSIHYFIFPQFLFPHPNLFEFLPIHCVSVLYCLCSFHTFNDGSGEFLTYPKLFSSIPIHPSQIINYLPFISPLQYTLSTLLLGGNTPYIVINILVVLSKLHSVSFICIPFQNSYTKSHYKNHQSINCNDFISSIQFQSLY